MRIKPKLEGDNKVKVSGKNMCDQRENCFDRKARGWEEHHQNVFVLKKSYLK